jgi:UDP-glucose 4-epimerase
MIFLITGAAGFIGSHLTDLLLQSNQKVIGLDNLSTGSLGNLEQALENPKFSFIQGSVLDSLILDEAVQNCDYVFHLAAAVGVKLIVERPLHSLVTNIRGTDHVVEVCHRYKKAILIASTSEIYGKNPKQALSENDDRVLGAPSIARWAYSVAKSVDEILAYAYFKEKNLPITVVRLFNTVGPRQSGAYGMVLPRFVQQAISGQPITVYGDGNQSRSFCHVSDVVRALYALSQTDKAVGEVFNVGKPDEIKIRELAELVIRLINSKSEIKFVPYDEAYESGFEDMLRRVPDIAKIKNTIGWEPEVDLETIIRDVAEYLGMKLSDQEL